MTDRPVTGSGGSSIDGQLRYTRRSSVYVSRSRTLDIHPPAPKHVPKPHIPENTHKAVPHQMHKSTVPKPAKSVAPAKPFEEEVSILQAAKLARENLPKVAKPTTHQLASEQVAYNSKNGLVSDMVHRQRLMTQPSAPRQQPSQALPKAEVAAKAAESKKRLMSRGSMLTAMACFVFLLGIGVSISTVITNKHATKQVQVLGESTSSNESDTVQSGDVPDEKPVSTKTVNSYQVAPDMPRKLIIKRAGVYARIKPLGVSQSNELLAPRSVFDVGWYNVSAKPGQDAGAAVMDGHVLGPTKGGVFGSLKKLAAGDVIDVERGDGRVVHYQVVRTAEVPADKLDMAQLMTSVKPGKQGLNLITCAGKFDPKSQTFNNRTIVFSVQAD